MRIHPLTLATLAFAAAACASTPGPEASIDGGAAAPREGIVFAVSPAQGGQVSLDPIVILTPGGLRDPWDIRDDSLFRARYLAPGTTYEIRQLGVPIRWATVREPLDPGCAERIGIAAAMPPTGERDDWRALASSVFGPAARNGVLRPVFSVEQWELSALADSIHLANDVGRELLPRTERKALWALDVPGLDEPVLAGSFDITIPSGDGIHTTYTQLLLAEKRGGRWVPVHVFHARDDGEVGRRSVLDVIDVEGDGVYELITQAMYAEGWGYTILKRGPDRWTEIYRGGGGGC